MFHLQADHDVTSYLENKVNCMMPTILQLLKEGKPGYIIEEICMDSLTHDLTPSKFNYIRTLLEKEFESYSLRIKETGLFVTEIASLVDVCSPIFNGFHFSEENVSDHLLHCATVRAIRGYFKSK